MPVLFDMNDPEGVVAGTDAARRAIASGELIVVPTDTVYGVAADAFSPAAVQRLLDAKGRTRQAPPPVLIADAEQFAALSTDVPPPVHRLIEEFWPGGLTVIVPAKPSLSWDLGETHGTVALRMPARDDLLRLLSLTGPLAVSSANRTGEPAAFTVRDAQEMLADGVAVYLDGGALHPPTQDAVAASSTIVDATRWAAGEPVRIIRHGAVSDDEIQRVLGR